MSDKDKNYISHTKDNLLILYSNLLQSNKGLEFIVRKLDKLSAALFIVSSHIPSDQPIRTLLQERGLKLIEQKMTVLGDRSIPVNNVLKSVTLSLVETVSYLTAATHAGFVSPMNHAILKEECEKLALVTEEQATREDALGASLGSEFFGTEREPLSSSGHHGHRAVSPREEERKAEAHGTLSGPSDHARSGESSAIGRVAEKKKNRRDLILGLLQTRTAVPIKDFSTVIKGCSEKTIQRELQEMVGEGVVEKQGERRWSTYSLKK